MPKPKKTWKEKLADNKGLPKVGPVTGNMTKSWGAGIMVIPAPAEVDDLMRRVPKRKLATIIEIRAALAKKHRADFACPITTGIFAWIAAHAAAEDEAAGEKRVTPYWRTLKSGGLLNEKYPGGVKEQRRRLLAEGHAVKKRGKHYEVADYERRLVSF
jgi:hypothetical protein